jgi:hypothetical protein
MQEILFRETQCRLGKSMINIGPVSPLHYRNFYCKIVCGRGSNFLPPLGAALAVIKWFCHGSTCRTVVCHLVALQPLMRLWVLSRKVKEEKL